MRKACITTAIFCLLAFAPSQALADKNNTSPDHVYQMAGLLEAYATEFAQADLVALPGRVTVTRSRLYPRHVMFRAVMLKNRIDVLRELHGLERRSDLRIGTEQITPRQVAMATQELTYGLQELAPIYGFPVQHEPEDLTSGKTPTDVYNRLSRIILILDQLYLPQTSPNDVYQLADTLHTEISLLTQSLPRTTLAINSDSDTNNAATPTPRDVYASVITTAKAVDALAKEFPDIAPTGGVIIPNTAGNTVSPTDVARILALLLADVNEMRLNAGRSNALVFAPPPTGKVPADVGERLAEIRQIIAPFALEN